MRSSGRDARALIEPVYTSLPPGEDGQVINFLASAANGVVWRLRYNAQSASAFRWEFIGGVGLRHEIGTTEATASTTFVDLATVGPTLTMALAGVYRATYSATGYTDTANGYAIQAPNFGGTTPLDVTSAVLRCTAATLETTVGRTTEGTVAAGGVIKVQYRAAGGTGSFSRRELMVTPVRVG